jgi:hypothetical protein
MRTTIDIEDDVLAAAKELARLQNVSAGHIVSKLMRTALAGGQPQTMLGSENIPQIGGFRPFASRGVLITNDLVNDLRDKEAV